METLNLGTSAPGTIMKVFGSSLSFSAMAPILLIPGCCDENAGFFDDSALIPSLAEAFRQAKLPFFLATSTDFNAELAPPIRGTIEEGGENLAVRIAFYSKIFGSKWIHLVGHSKGGLNARFVLGKRPTAVAGIGIRSLVTMNTPHLGSIAGDVASARLDQAGVNFRQVTTAIEQIVLRTVLDTLIKKDGQLNTIRDLTQADLKAFNATYPTPPADNAVNSIRRPVVAKATISDANADGSGETSDVTDAQQNVTSYGRRSISTAESKVFLRSKYAPTFVSDRIGVLALEPLYNLIGKTSSVKLTKDANGKITAAEVQLSKAPFQFNDGLVTVGSQTYDNHPNFLPLAPLFAPSQIQKGSARGGLTGGNHQSTGTGGVGNELVKFYKAGTPR